MSRLNGIRLASGVGTYRCAPATCESTWAHYKTQVVRPEFYRNLMIPRLPENYIFDTRNSQEVTVKSPRISIK